MIKNYHGTKKSAEQFQGCSALFFVIGKCSYVAITSKTRKACFDWFHRNLVIRQGLYAAKLYIIMKKQRNKEGILVKMNKDIGMYIKVWYNLYM